MIKQEPAKGPVFESAVLGTSGVERGFFYNPNQKVDFKSEIDKVKSTQGCIGKWNPKSPSTETSSVLFGYVISNLEDNRRDDLRFYSALGTSLDVHYGIDCFFLLKNRDYDSIFSIDLTTNPRKVESKADVVIHPEDFQNEDFLKETGRKIANFLTRRPLKNDKKHFIFKNTKR